jgi:hypothetical protein
MKLFPILTALLLTATAAQAQNPRPRPEAAPRFDHTDEPREGAVGLTPLICDPLNLLPGCKSPVTGQTVTSDASKAITQVFTSLAAFIDQGVVEAEQLAMAIPDLPDGVGQQCWMQMRKTSAVFKAHPVPVTLQLPLDLQAIRLLVMSANDLCASSACTQLFSDAANLATAAAGAGGFSIPIPSLASVCSKIPVIRSTPTVADPTLPPVTPVPVVPAPAPTPPP